MEKPRLVIYKDVAGEYRWYLQAVNGEKVAASEGYTTKQSAITSAEWVKELSADAEIIDSTHD